MIGMAEVIADFANPAPGDLILSGFEVIRNMARRLAENFKKSFERRALYMIGMKIIERQSL